MNMIAKRKMKKSLIIYMFFGEGGFSSMEIERKDKSYCVITRTSVVPQQQRRTEIQTSGSLHVLMCLIWKHVSIPQKTKR